MAKAVDMERVRTDRLAAEIAEQLRAPGHAVVRETENVGDAERWRRAARQAGRMLGMTVRTGVSPDGTRVWASEGP